MRLRRTRTAHYAGWAAVRPHYSTSTSHWVQSWASFRRRLDARVVCGIIQITRHGRSRLAETPRDEKAAALRRQHALNPRAQTVRDSTFTAGNDFFDARDLVQVKYEMLRRASADRETTPGRPRLDARRCGAAGTSIARGSGVCSWWRGAVPGGRFCCLDEGLCTARAGGAAGPYCSAPPGTAGRSRRRGGAPA